MLVSLENVVIDVHELENGMNTTKREFEASSSCGSHSGAARILNDFLVGSADKMNKLKHDCKAAQVHIGLRLKLYMFPDDYMSLIYIISIYIHHLHT